MFPTVVNSLSVGMSHFSLIYESVAAQFLMGKKTNVEKVLLHWGQQKVCLSEGRPTLVMFHLFISRGNKHTFRAYPATLKIAETVLWNNSHTFYNYLQHLAWLSPSLRSRNMLSRYTATSAHFGTSRKHYVHCTPKQCSRLDTAFNTRFKATGCIKLTKRVELWIDFWQLDNIFESLVRTNSLYGKWTVNCP